MTFVRKGPGRSPGLLFTITRGFPLMYVTVAVYAFSIGAVVGFLLGLSESWWFRRQLREIKDIRNPKSRYLNLRK